VLQSGIRHEDMASRTGKARFSLLLPGMNKTGIRNLADRINREISARILKQGETRIRFTVSIGVAAPDIVRDTRFEDLLSVADSRLVYATSSGGNQVIYEGSEKQPPVPQDAAEVTETTEPAPLVLEEVTANTPEAEETVAEAVAETELTLEDIEDFAAEEITLANDETPAVECRSTIDPDSEPARFSGPVSELATDNTSEPAVFTTSTPANEPIDTPASTPEVTGNKASMDHWIILSAKQLLSVYPAVTSCPTNTKQNPQTRMQQQRIPMLQAVPMRQLPPMTRRPKMKQSPASARGFSGACCPASVQSSDVPDPLPSYPVTHGRFNRPCVYPSAEYEYNQAATTDKSQEPADAFL